MLGEPGPFGMLVFPGGLMGVVDAADFETAKSLVISVHTQARGQAYVSVSPARAKAAGFGGVQRLHAVVARNAPGSGLVVDHINGCGLTNCRWNLRKVTPAQNSSNKFRGPTRLCDFRFPAELIGQPCVGVHHVSPGESLWEVAAERQDALFLRRRREAEAEARLRRQHPLATPRGFWL